MKFVTVSYNNVQKTGIMNHDLTQVIFFDSLGLTKQYSSLVDFIENYSTSDFEALCGAAKTQTGVSAEQVKFCAPIPDPKRDVICLGLNYMDHVQESNRAHDRDFMERSKAVYFGKRVDRAIGTGEAIQSHRDITNRLDYEVELAVIMGKNKGRYIEGEAILESIFGYTVLNDVSARELQHGHNQWYLGKGLDGFTAMGPWIVTKDEIKNHGDLTITSKVNNELRQNNNTKNMIFSIEHVIEELTKGITLYPGDIIATGTPSGVGMGFNPPKFLAPGDIVSCEIEQIGVLSNKVGD